MEPRRSAETLKSYAKARYPAPTADGKLVLYVTGGVVRLVSHCFAEPTARPDSAADDVSPCPDLVALHCMMLALAPAPQPNVPPLPMLGMAIAEACNLLVFHGMSAANAAH
jgi:hypothetical protein